MARSDSYDLQRTLRMAGYGMAILGPTLHFWFNQVSRLFPKRDLVSTLKKMLMGQAIYGPIMTAVFFSVNACLQGNAFYLHVLRHSILQAPDPIALLNRYAKM